jgi:multidrug resistance protein, MATE family
METRSTHWLGPEVWALARLAGPVALASAGVSTMNLVSSAVLGRAGTLPLAAYGLSNNVFGVLSTLAVGLMMGLDPLMSQAFGAGDRARARGLLWQGAWLALASGGAIAALGLVLPLVLEPLGIEPTMAVLAGRCIWVRLPLLPVLLFFGAQRTYLTAAGRTTPLLVATAAANAANLPLSLLLVFGGGSLPDWFGPLRLVPAWGAVGAALASALSLCLAALVLALAIGGVELGEARSPATRRPSLADILGAVRVGLPVGLHMVAEVGVFSVAGLLAGVLGEVPMAAHQIALNYATFTFTLAVGVGSAGSVRVGWAVGARDTRQARRSGLAAFATGAGGMCAGALVFLLFPGPLARLMTDRPEAIAAAAPLLMIAALFQVSDGIQGVGAGVLRGAADTRFTFVANLVGHWCIGFPIAWGLGIFFGWGITGLWWGLSLGLTAVAAAVLVRFLRISARGIEPVAFCGPAAGQPEQTPLS